MAVYLAASQEKSTLAAISRAFCIQENDMPSTYWIKLYHEILRDPKMGRLPDRAWRRAIELFLLAGEIGEDGDLPSVADIAWQLRLDESELEEDMATLAEVGILTVTDGEWYVTKFATRQGPSPVGERVARYRDRKRKAQYDGIVSETTGEQGDNENGNGGVTTRYTESDTDTDTEPEPEEKASSSFLSQCVRSFENGIGLVTGQTQSREIADVVEELETRGLPDWWQMALDISLDNNGRSWSYMRAVLYNWLKEGKPSITRPRLPMANSPPEMRVVEFNDPVTGKHVVKEVPA